MAKKIYAVRRGKKTGIFATWEECRRQVEGYSNAQFCSFVTREAAQEYLAGADSAGIREAGAPDTGAQPENAKTLIAYVDGSFDKKLARYSFGCVLLLPDGQIVREGGNGNEKESLALRNVTGEMLGAMYAVRWAVANGFAAVDIRYDYAGIEQWATHGWRAKNELTQKYTAYMDRQREKIQITFTKIAAHTGDCYNEEADRLAKAALTQADGIPPVSVLHKP